MPEAAVCLTAAGIVIVKGFVNPEKTLYLSCLREESTSDDRELAEVQPETTREPRK
jgi:hypothetical protein